MLIGGTGAAWAETAAPLLGTEVRIESLSGDAHGLAGEELRFNAVVRAPAGAAVSYAWAFGDGGRGGGVGAASVRHTYARTGTHTVTLTVRAGGASDSQSYSAVVRWVPPEAQQGPVRREDTVCLVTIRSLASPADVRAFYERVVAEAGGALLRNEHFPGGTGGRNVSRTFLLFEDASY